MGFFSKLFSPKPAKLNVFDLLYAYMRRGTPWGPLELTWNMKNYYDNHAFSDGWERILELGLVEKAQSEDRLCYLTVPELKDCAKQCGEKVSGAKADLIARLMQNANINSIIDSLPPVVGLSQIGKELLRKHDYIPYLVKRCSEVPAGHQRMFEIRERKPDYSPQDVITRAVNEKDFLPDWYFDDPDLDDSDERYCRRIAEKGYENFIALVRKDFG